MPVQCCYTPQGRSFEEYLKYLQGEAEQFEVDENNIEFNFCVAQKMSENASSKAAEMPDEAYVYAMGGAHFLQRMLTMEDNQLWKYSLKHKSLEGKKAVRSVFMDCIAIAESIVSQEGGPLHKLYRMAFAEEESQQAMRSSLLEKQHMKGELDRGHLTSKDDDKPIEQKEEKLLRMEEKLLRMQAKLNGVQYVPPALVQPLPPVAPFLLLVGNSGVGKSLIGNALVGDGVFASSHQVASVTASAQSADMYDPQGKFWRVIDMPGLMEADSRNLQRNTQEITKAFNAASGQPVVVAFVLTLEGGRMRAEHVETINNIQNSVRGLTQDNTVIVVNKVGDDEPEEEVRGIIRRFFPNHKHVSVVKYFPDNVRRNQSHSAFQNGVAGVHAVLKACTAATIQAQAIQAQTAEAERQRREKALRDEADRQRKAEQQAAERREAERQQQIWLARQRAAEVQRQAELDRKMLEEEKAKERARVAKAEAVKEQMRWLQQRQEEERRQEAERERERQEERRQQQEIIQSRITLRIFYGI